MVTDPDFKEIDKVLAGDLHAYPALIDRYKRYVYSIILKVLQNKFEAEEAAQDTFVKAYHALKNFNRESKFSTWLYRIAFNTAISYKRRQNKPHYDIEETVISHTDENTLEKKDKAKFVHQAMNQLSDTDRRMLTLFYLQEFSLEEISEITSSPANTIKVRIHRARQRMAEELLLLLKKEALTL